MRVLIPPLSRRARAVSLCNCLISSVATGLFPFTLVSVGAALPPAAGAPPAPAARGVAEAVLPDVPAVPPLVAPERGPDGGAGAADAELPGAYAGVGAAVARRDALGALAPLEPEVGAVVDGAVVDPLNAPPDGPGDDLRGACAGPDVYVRLPVCPPCLQWCPTVWNLPGRLRRYWRRQLPICPWHVGLRPCSYPRR